MNPVRPDIKNRNCLRIAWVGPVPTQGGGVGEVATELLVGLAEIGHEIECYFPTGEMSLPEQVRTNANLSFVWSSSKWRWNRWYSRNPLGAFITSLAARARAFARLRRTIEARHRENRYDLIYQFSAIETIAISRKMRKDVPLVIHPEVHSAGELRWMFRERRLARRCQPWYRGVTVGGLLAARSVVQRIMIRRAALVVCISSVFRDHLIRDYKVSRERTVVIPNPVRLDRFAAPENGVLSEGLPTAVVLGRIAVRKGIDQIVELSHILRRRELDVQLRIIGGSSLWSDYRPLLEELDPDYGKYEGEMPASDIPSALREADMLIQASKYEPFGLTVAEGLASGLPVIATTEVGAIEGTSELAAAAVPAGDPGALADAIEAFIRNLAEDPRAVRAAAREDAERLFAPDVVCLALSDVLEDLA